ncbi:MAG: glutamate decarboxylase [Lachnospiraceae bacterium]
MLYSKKTKEKLEYRHVPPIFGTEFSDHPMPKYEMSDVSIDPAVAYQIIKDDLLDEGNARQNLATFCQTYMEPQAVQLMSETLEKNAIDKSEYPQTAELENRCVNMIANLWHAQGEEEFIGTSTVGSSEACMLGGLAMKFAWRDKAAKAGIDIQAKKPNIVISSGFQVCWEKFCVYWDVELRTVPLDKDHMSLNMDTVMNYVDDYTIGVVAILGITYTGRLDDVKTLDGLLTVYNQTAKIPVHIHVDGASGAMFVPFVHPEIIWDFQLKNVISINTSGHKYGLVYPGIGWVIWRDKQFLPKELIFEVSYLGGSIPTIAINFSHSAAQVIGQYYNFVRFGFNGYRGIHQKTRDVAMFIGKQMEKMGCFELFIDGDEIPLVAWRLKEDANKQWDLYDLADRIRMNGWQVPAYPLPDNMSDVVIQRIVVRADLSMQLAVLLLEDLKRAMDDLDQAHLMSHSNGTKTKGPSGFIH